MFHHLFRLLQHKVNDLYANVDPREESISCYFCGLNTLAAAVNCLLLLIHQIIVGGFCITLEII